MIQEEINNIKKAVNYLAKVVETNNQLLKQNIDLLQQILSQLITYNSNELRKQKAFERFDQILTSLEEISEYIMLQIKYKDKADLILAYRQRLRELKSQINQTPNYYEIRERIVQTQKELLKLEGYDI